MTEREKLKAIFEAFEVEAAEAKGSFTAAGRRFFFTPDGTLTKIISGPRGDRQIVKVDDAKADERSWEGTDG